MKHARNHGALAPLVSYMQEGYTWQAAAALAGVPVSLSTAYRLYKALRERGEVALQDGRHGHPSKFRGAARTFLEDACRGVPQIPSSVIQRLLHERFALGVSLSQINRTRAALGVSNRRQHQEQGKNRRKSGPVTPSRMARGCGQPAVTRRCPSNGPSHVSGNNPLAKHPHR